MNSFSISKQDILKTYLSKSVITVIIGILTSILYLSVISYLFLSNKNIYLLMFEITLGCIALSFILIVNGYKKNYNSILQNLIQEKYINFENEIKTKYINFIDSDFFNKLNNLETLLDNRFSKTGIFNARVKQLLNETLDIYINNLALITEIDSLQNPLINKEIEINELKENNKQLLMKIDIFIKEIVIESKENLEIESLVNEFERNMQMFYTLKAIKKDSLFKGKGL